MKSQKTWKEMTELKVDNFYQTVSHEENIHRLIRATERSIENIDLYNELHDQLPKIENFPQVASIVTEELKSKTRKGASAIKSIKTFTGMYIQNYLGE